MVDLLTVFVAQTENPGVYQYRAAQCFYSVASGISSLDLNRVNLEVLPSLFEGNPLLRRGETTGELQGVTSSEADEDEDVLLLMVGDGFIFAKTNKKKTLTWHE
jgi:hypothetical protein